MAIADWLFGRRLATLEAEHQRVGMLAGIPMLGLDALASAAYGPEAALTPADPPGVDGVRYIGPITTLIIALLLIVYVSYRQTIAALPDRRRVVHRGQGEPGHNRRPARRRGLDAGLRPGCGRRHLRRSGGAGLRRANAAALHAHLCLAILALITVVNLRGVRESGLAFAVPTYLFVVSLVTVLALGVVKALLAGGSRPRWSCRQCYRRRRRWPACGS